MVSQLDVLASDFAPEEPARLSAPEQAAALTAHLSAKLGFEGNRKLYDDPENSYLDSVLQRRTGIPISLAVVYMAVARRVGIPTLPVAFPGHFLIRVGAPSGVLVDPFEGRLLSTSEPDDVSALLTRVAGPSAVLRPEHLAPVGVSEVAQRMLLNLKRLHDAQRNYAQGLVVTDRLVELTGSPELRRDRGMLALKLGATQVAASDLAHYLLKRPNASDAAEIRSALARSRKDVPRAN